MEFIRVRELLILLIILLYSCCIKDQVRGSPLLTSNEEAYLKRFGYLKPTIVKDGGGYSLVQLPVHNALKSLQRMAGLSQTGKMDEETRQVMSLPRCGVPDIVHGRVKRSDSKGKWLKTDLKYFFRNYTMDLSQEVLESEIRRAFQIWSDVTPVKFDRCTDLNSADIEISFDKLEHGDNDNFDGPGGILAHAFYPQNGDIHFDDDETFTSNSFTGSNLFQIAVHEIGHSLGLDHSSEPGSIMAPFYRGYSPDLMLHSDDINRIQSVYGEKNPEDKLTTVSPDENVSTVMPEEQQTTATTIRLSEATRAPAKPSIPGRRRGHRRKKPKSQRDSSEENDRSRHSRRNNKQKRRKEKEEKKKRHEESKKKKKADKDNRKQEKKKSKSTSKKSSGKSKTKTKSSSRDRRKKNKN